MKAFELSKQFNHKYLSLVKEKIGEGADGDCYTISSNIDQVIKFSVYYCWQKENPNQIIKSKLIGYSEIQKYSNLFAKLYEYGFIGKGNRNTVDGNQDYLIFYCLMEKLNKISEDEKKVFHSILSHEDRNIVKKYSLNKISEILSGLSLGLTFDHGKVIEFTRQVMEMKIKYTDIHPRNIMKDKFNNYKFIDFDRIVV